MIRKIEEKDRKSWIELTGEFYSSSAVDHAIPESFREKTFDELMKNSPYAFAVMIEYEGTTAGYALFAKTFSQEAGGHVIWIEEAYIRENFRRKGLGHELFEWTEKNFPETARFRLEVEDDNTGAVKLYSSLGYKKLAYSQMIKDSLI